MRTSQFTKNITELTAAVDFATVGERTVVLSNNKLAIMNNISEVITISPIPQVSCNNLVYDDKVGLLLFCSSS